MRRAMLQQARPTSDFQKFRLCSLFPPFVGLQYPVELSEQTVKAQAAGQGTGLTRAGAARVQLRAAICYALCDPDDTKLQTDAVREMAGYSQTPLSKKLGIKPGSIVLTLAAPRDYRDWLAPLPADVSFVTKPRAKASATSFMFSLHRWQRSGKACTAQRAQSDENRWRDLGVGSRQKIDQNS